jgi:membrane protease YdiL (CAAX protease family)
VPKNRNRSCEGEHNPERRSRVESIQALLVLFLPLLIVVPVYLFVPAWETRSSYIMYGFYILFSIIIVKHNARPLGDIGIMGKHFWKSLTYSIPIVFVSLFLLWRRSGLVISPGLSLSYLIERGIYSFLFSGLGQEILFRGLILFSFWRWKGKRTALIASSLLFGLMHIRMGPRGMISTTFFGIYYGAIVLETKNIGGPAIIHGLYNYLFGPILVT